jgi:hypothetical protein
MYIMPRVSYIIESQCGIYVETIVIVDGWQVSLAAILPREFSGPRMIQSAELERIPCCRNTTGLLGAAGDLGL